MGITTRSDRLLKMLKQSEFQIELNNLKKNIGKTKNFETREILEELKSRVEELKNKRESLHKERLINKQKEGAIKGGISIIEGSVTKTARDLIKIQKENIRNLSIKDKQLRKLNNVVETFEKRFEDWGGF